MTTPVLYLLAFSLLALISSQVHAATCSCAGIPLLNSMDASSADNGKFYLNISYENHEISDLVSGSDDVRDETRRDRRSQTLLLELSYGISKMWSVSGVVSAIKHEREIGISGLGKESARGFGDGIVLLKYTPLRITPYSRNEVALGFGARVPIGEDNAGGAVTLAEDMQPSTGAWASVFWGSYGRAFHASAKLQLLSLFNYTLNGENERDYAFGDEMNLAGGINYQSESRLAFSVLLRYRTTEADQRNGNKIPNTGGKWIDFVPAVQYSLTENFATKLSGRIPVHRDLKGALQFTTSYSYMITFSYLF